MIRNTDFFFKIIFELHHMKIFCPRLGLGQFFFYIAFWSLWNWVAVLEQLSSTWLLFFFSFPPHIASVSLTSFSSFRSSLVVLPPRCPQSNRHSSSEFLWNDYHITDAVLNIINIFTKSISPRALCRRYYTHPMQIKKTEAQSEKQHA